MNRNAAFFRCGSHKTVETTSIAIVKYYIIISMTYGAVLSLNEKWPETACIFYRRTKCGNTRFCHLFVWSKGGRPRGALKYLLIYAYTIRF